jgi:hypothetical protein
MVDLNSVSFYKEALPPKTKEALPPKTKEALPPKTKEAKEKDEKSYYLWNI